MRTIYCISVKIICILCILIGISCTKDPIADFDYNGPLLVHEPIEFINHSMNANEFAWDFGDDSISVDISPIHYYADTGRYCITLTAFGSNNSSSMSKYIHIEMILLNEDLPVLCK